MNTTHNSKKLDCNKPKRAYKGPDLVLFGTISGVTAGGSGPVIEQRCINLGVPGRNLTRERC